MKKPLKHSLQTQLKKQRLSAKQINHLLKIQSQHTKSAKPYFPRYKIMALASAVILSFVLGLFYTSSSYFLMQPIEQRIAKEVAENHFKLKPLEVNANTLKEISGYFKLLDFSPVSPSVFNLSEQHLLGARYCSIQGITALQLRMVNNETNKVQTLYETQYDKRVFKAFPELKGSSKTLTVYVKGMKVDMWIEKDILFALIE